MLSLNLPVMLWLTNRRVCLGLWAFFLVGQQETSYRSIQGATCHEVPSGEGIERTAQLPAPSELQSGTPSC